MATNQKRTKVTLQSVFKENNIEVLTYIDKNVLVENGVLFCITKAVLIPVPDSKFDVKEQWQLTIATPTSDGTVRKYWLTFTPNEVRNEVFPTIVKGLEQAHEMGMNAVHGCKLEAIKLANYNHPLYILNFSSDVCSCKLDD